MRGIRRSRTLVQLAGLLAFVAAWPTDAEACVCSPPSRSQSRENISYSLQRALAVFTGEAVEVGRLKTTLKVIDVWKGKLEPEVPMWTVTRSWTWPRTWPIGPYVQTSCDYYFRQDRRYLVFAYGASVTHMKTAVCSPTTEMEYAKPAIAILDEITRKGGGR